MEETVDDFLLCHEGDRMKLAIYRGSERHN